MTDLGGNTSLDEGKGREWERGLEGGGGTIVRPDHAEKPKNSNDLSQDALSDVLRKVDIESSERLQMKGIHIPPPKPTRSVIPPPKNLRSKESQRRGVKKNSAKDGGKSCEIKPRKVPGVQS